ncbi:MAG: hypothetical protein ABIO67_04105 [Mycobacteriales bacterium]
MGRHRTPQEKVQLAELARQMRAAGRSRREIAADLHVGDDLLTELLQGTEVPVSLRRRKAKDHLRDRARELREAGWTYPQIARELGVSKSSCSLWLRDMDHPEPSLEGQARRTAAIRASAARQQVIRERERQAIKESAAARVGVLSDRELDIVAATAYWCEGSKDKPYDRRESVIFINSDPTLIAVWMEWLRRRGYGRDRLRLNLAIHESADLVYATRYWAELAGVDPGFFGKPSLKRHNPKTVRKNVGPAYVGCLVVRVLQGRRLYQEIEGIWRGIATGALPQAGHVAS